MATTQEHADGEGPESAILAMPSSGKSAKVKLKDKEPDDDAKDASKDGPKEERSGLARTKSSPTTSAR